MTGSAAITGTAFQSTGCVTKKMTARTGVMRNIVRRKLLLLASISSSNCWPLLVQALNICVEMVFASL
jgi:hypothetical protein